MTEKAQYHVDIMGNTDLTKVSIWITSNKPMLPVEIRDVMGQFFAENTIFHATEEGAEKDNASEQK